MNVSHSPHRSPGRPRTFDMDAALDQAILVFSQRGYAAASISELTAAMGLTAGSLYKAFADKRAVFLAAFDRYKLLRDSLLSEILAQPGTGRERLRRALEFYAESAHGTLGRQGCLVVGSAAELAFFDPEIAERITRSMARNETLLAGLLRDGQADGSIAAHLDIPATAKLLLCLQQGMRVVGKTGQQRAAMLATVPIALKILD